MTKFLVDNGWRWRLLRTIVQGVLGVIVANIDVLVGAVVLDPASRAIVVALCMAVLGWFFVDKRLIICIIFGVFYGINALNNGPANVFEAEVNREINDYTEYVTGERPDGTIHIITNLIMRITAPLNAMFTIFLFKWSGYDTTLPMLPWAQENKVVYQKVWFLFNGITLAIVSECGNFITCNSSVTICIYFIEIR